jgi:hypothetical protein
VRLKALPGRRCVIVLLRYDPCADEGPITKQVIARSGKKKTASGQVLRGEGRVIPIAARGIGIEQPAGRREVRLIPAQPGQTGAWHLSWISNG